MAETNQDGKVSEDATVFVALKYLSTRQLSAEAAEEVEAVEDSDRVAYRKTI